MSPFCLPAIISVLYANDNPLRAIREDRLLVAWLSFEHRLIIVW